jgi:hypothetical protein
VREVKSELGGVEETQEEDWKKRKLRVRPLWLAAVAVALEAWGLGSGHAPEEHRRAAFRQGRDADAEGGRAVTVSATDGRLVVRAENRGERAERLLGGAVGRRGEAGRRGGGEEGRRGGERGGETSVLRGPEERSGIGFPPYGEGGSWFGSNEI